MFKINYYKRIKLQNIFKPSNLPNTLKSPNNIQTLIRIFYYWGKELAVLVYYHIYGLITEYNYKFHIN